MLVHSSDIIKNVFIEQSSQIFILNVEQSEEKLNSFNRIQNIFSSKNHNRSHTFLPNIGVEIRPMIFQQINHLFGYISQFFGEMPDTSGQEDQQLCESLVFSLDIR